MTIFEKTQHVIQCYVENRHRAGQEAMFISNLGILSPFHWHCGRPMRTVRMFEIIKKKQYCSIHDSNFKERETLSAYICTCKHCDYWQQEPADYGY